jgi:hypothetical protein
MQKALSIRVVYGFLQAPTGVTAPVGAFFVFSLIGLIR